MTDEQRSPSPDRSSGYDIGLLEAAWGPTPLYAERIDVDRDKYEEITAEQRRDELGGARVLLYRPEDSAVLLVSNRGEYGWDIPGGARESGESPEATACRECYEETNLVVELRDLRRIYEFTFSCSAAGRDIAGLWLHFEGIPRDEERSLQGQDSELEDAQWMTTPPDRMDEYAKPLIREYLA